MAQVKQALISIGYQEDSANLLGKIFCLNEFLAQGAPSSPVLSNICFAEADTILATYAANNKLTYTRYADDLVFSGTGVCPDGLLETITECITSKGWQLSAKKTKLSKKPAQLKVHGLLVHGNCIRLPKIYRNKIRAYKYLLAKNMLADDDVLHVRGHINYSEFIDQQ